MSVRPIWEHEEAGEAAEAAMARALPELLGRVPRALDWEAAGRMVRGRVMLITGAGGSIGGALARAVARLRPAGLALLDHAEYPLWRICQDVAALSPALPARMVIADIRDGARLRRVLAEARPDFIVHAAALKHVPVVQEHPLEGLLTNTIGTRNLVDAARAAGCPRIVLISTDKAVAPESIMGASKRQAEMYGQAVDIEAKARGEAARCVSLRLGNVMGSAGSVAQLFQRQLAAGLPLTVTHRDMRRFFIAPAEAIALVLGAGELATDDTLPPGAVLVPELGAPLRILDLARRMIAANGRKVPIRFTAPRAGEKLQEQMCHGADPAHRTRDPDLMAVVPHAPALGLLARRLAELEAVCRVGEERLALEQVSRLIPGFSHRPEGRAVRLRA